MKLTVRLRGRERANPGRASELLEKLAQDLSTFGKPAHGPPKSNGAGRVSHALAPTSEAMREAREARKKITLG